MEITNFFVLALFLFLPIFIVSFPDEEINSDQLALLALKSSIIAGPTSILTKNWTSDAPVCNWAGVTCGARHHRVTGLNLNSMSLAGTIPPQLGNLSFLSFIDLSNNGFHGSLPKDLVKLHRLRVLILSYNELSGNIPSWIGNLSNLEFIIFENNSFTGSIPRSLYNLSKLEVISLFSNEVEGVIPDMFDNLYKLRSFDVHINKLTGEIPCTLFGLSSIQAIDLGNNNLSGILRDDMCNNSTTNLENIDLNKNNFGGELQGKFQNCYSLRVLSIGENKFSGNIPRELGNLTSLLRIQFNINQFTGEIPPELGQLYNLKLLTMSSNGLTGAIPQEIFNLSGLSSLDLGRNHLTGNLPSAMGQGLSNLEDIYIYLNELEGVIPDVFDNFVKLRNFDVDANKFTGEIPYTLFGLSSIQTIIITNNNLSGILRDDMCNNSNTNLQDIYLYRNNFGGELQRKFQNCYALHVLALRENKFSGKIPRELGNLTSLVDIDFDTNQLTGEIPPELGQLYNLKLLSLSSNGLTGAIPQGLFNLSGLNSLGLGNNQLTGNLPSAMGQGFCNLEALHLHFNNLNGPIPESISNCSRLRVFSILKNEFTGLVPHSLGDLSLLQYLFLGSNNLTSDGSLTFITSLTKCIYLYFLDFSGNPMNGVLPSSVGNLSTFLITFAAEDAMIKGNLPLEFGNMSSLIQLLLSDNQISGSFPESFRSSQKLQRLYLENNLMDGSLTTSLCYLKSLGEIYLSNNQFSGSIPNCLGNVTTLRYLYLDGNKLSSIIPETLWDLKDVMKLSLSSNNLSGPLSSRIGNLKSMLFLDVSFNQLSAGIPTTIGGLINLKYLSLANNHIQGSIPDSFGGMLSLVFLNLSHNNISGLIPKSLDRLKFFQEFDVSFNHLKGEIPSCGHFNDFTNQSFLFNDALCSNNTKYNVPKCPPSSRHHTSRKMSVLYIILGVSLLAMALSLTLVVFVLRCKTRNNIVQRQELKFFILPQRILYYELVQATNGFNESNWLGSGSYGSVYKGVLKDGTLVAIKRFDIHGEEDAFKSFDRECEVLRGLRHRNLTKVISSCSNDDFKAIVLEYMPGGSLEKWLYAHNYSLSIHRRLEIMLDVACALEYLHDGCLPPVVHCDIKPSNVLLDEDMVAHVSDFGISKLLYDGNSIDHTNTLATFGYIAPEYGSEGLISTRCDVYSYGIMLMEVFTRLKPTDEILFGGDKNNSLKSWVKDNTTLKVVDSNLLKANERHLEDKLKCVSTIFDVALGCCVDSPIDRLNMKQVVARLHGIKVQFKTYLGET